MITVYPRHHDPLDSSHNQPGVVSDSPYDFQDPHPRMSTVSIPGCSAALHRAAGRKPSDGIPNTIVLYGLHQVVLHNDWNGMDW